MICARAGYKRWANELVLEAAAAIPADLTKRLRTTRLGWPTMTSNGISPIAMARGRSSAARGISDARG
jgi:hypothetical protein